MDAYQHIIAIISLTMGVAWASGINLYATIAMLGILGASGNIVLPESLMVLQDPLVIIAACVMYCVEFIADKTPGVDTGWDAIHSFIRIPAGVILAAGAVGEVSPAMAIAAGILGGAVSATSHVIKAGSRVLINTSPEPFSNWTASVVEDITVLGGLWAALHYPVTFLIGFAIFCVMAIWVLPKIWMGIRLLFIKIRGIFQKNSPPTDYPQPPSPQIGRK